MRDFFYYKVVVLLGGGSVINAAYPTSFKCINISNKCYNNLFIDEPLSRDVCLSVVLFVCAISLKWDSRHNYYPNGMHFRSTILVGIAAILLPKRPVDNHDDDDDDNDDCDKNNDHKDNQKTTIYIDIFIL